MCHRSQLHRFGPFLAHFWPISGKVPPGEPQISVVEGRFEVKMVRQWSNVVSNVNWSQFGPGWSQPEAGWSRVLEIFCHFWPFLAHFGPFMVKHLLENPRFLWRTVGLTSLWCGNGPMLYLKSIEVGLEWVGGDQRRFGGEFWRFFVIFCHFWSFLDQKFL